MRLSGKVAYVVPSVKTFCTLNVPNNTTYSRGSHTVLREGHGQKCSLPYTSYFYKKKCATTICILLIEQEKNLNKAEYFFK